LNAGLSPQVEKKIKTEIALMKKCHHRHIVKLREVIDDPLNKKIFLGENLLEFLYYSGLV
jgi:hypothetical protein